MEKGKGGRPKSDLNWPEINQLLVAGCSGVEVAGYVGVSKETIYDRCLIDNGVGFSEYSQKMKAKGESLLRAHQFAKALGKTEKGDNTLLIWLGKQRLDQRDKPKSEEVEDEVIRRLAQGIPDIEKVSATQKAGRSKLEA